jgi:hypothetical protein
MKSLRTTMGTTSIRIWTCLHTDVFSFQLANRHLSFSSDMHDVDVLGDEVMTCADLFGLANLEVSFVYSDLVPDGC